MWILFENFYVDRLLHNERIECLLYEEQTQMYDDEIWCARIHILVLFFFFFFCERGILTFFYIFFFFFLFLRTRNLNIVWHSFDIIDQYYSRVNNMNSIIHQWNGISRAKRAYYFWKLCLYNDDRHSVIVRWRDLCKK